MPRGNFYRPESFISPTSGIRAAPFCYADRTVWLYARIPWSTALLDGANDRKRNDAAQQLMAFFDGLLPIRSRLPVCATVTASKRISRIPSTHRIHAPSDTVRRPARGTPTSDRYQAQYYRSQKVCKQFAVIGSLKLVGDHSNNRARGNAATP